MTSISENNKKAPRHGFESWGFTNGTRGVPYFVSLKARHPTCGLSLIACWGGLLKQCGSLFDL